MEQKGKFNRNKIKKGKSEDKRDTRDAKSRSDSRDTKPKRGGKKVADKRNFSHSKSKPKKSLKTSDEVRLNKYIANAGICSRREADKLIEAGAVKINGKVVTQLGTKVKPGDTVQLGEETLAGQKKVYILLNKPKDYITTVSDPQGRRTVVQLLRGACKERVYPVGRLDRMSTGLLLFTNDGEMARKLTHPSSNVRKVYHVILDKKITKVHMEELVKGVKLDDGISQADRVEYVQGADSKKAIGIELHSGKNRVIRRMMEALGYKVVKLDRVLFAGISKKGIPRGKWRKLTEKEIGYLQIL
ncbi:MAG: rRNA pseudouridine synthase [Flavobacteriales bacterium]|nr:rRNA pseudouridine synthase [Flavobacteriales bacterium]